MKKDPKLTKYLKKIDLFAFRPQVIALAYCLGVPDPSEVIGIPIEDAGCSEEEFERLVLMIDAARIEEEYASI